VSGVTFQTSPSGTTIYGTTIDTTTINATTITATTGNITTSTSGYILNHDTISEKSVAGYLDCAGTSLARQALGLTLVKHVMAVPCFNRAAVSSCAIVVVKPKTGAWASGVTHVDFYVFATPQGGVFNSAVSIAYWAIGT